jgi:polygalacturonase
MAGAGPTSEFDGVVTIDGASGVTIQGFTVQNGPGEGILGTHGAAFSVRNSTVQDNGSTGVAVGEGSTAELTDCRPAQRWRYRRVHSIECRL